jgi:high-affinity Fe2+/Pb2+ permease
MTDGSSLEAAEKQQWWAIFVLAFTAVFREGVESVMFLAGLGGNTAITAIPIAGAVRRCCACR